MSNARPATDEESAPLLASCDARHDNSFFSALTHPSRSLTNLEKILAGAGLILLLLMSTFIGLFVGAQNKLGQETGKHQHGSATETLTTTATTTSLATTTVSSPPTVPTGSPKAELCLTQDCVLLSASILESLNTTVDPCEDFYGFANGGWESRNEIPADRGVYGIFNQVADKNKKIILKVLDAIPSERTRLAPSAEEANLHKLKTVFTSCMDVDALNANDIQPLRLDVEYVLNNFGRFDLVPAPDAELMDAARDWQGSWDDSYILPDHLVAAAARVDELKEAKKTARMKWNMPVASEVRQVEAIDEVEERRVDKEWREKMTMTLSFLHSRGISALLNFVIEGDAGGNDSQFQGLSLYQDFGGLPSKEYYEEAPILDLYQSVVKSLLVDVAEAFESDRKASLTKASSERDLAGDLVLAEAEGWPWPWPGDDDKGGDSKKPGKVPAKGEPVGDRMEKLAGKIVSFERELIRAGVEPEYLYNPHYSYNPYAADSVDKALPFLDLPNYISTFVPRHFPENITVTHPPYLRSLTKIINATPDYVLSGYFITRIAMTHSSALGPKVGVRQQTRRLEEVLRGLKKDTEENRQDVCLSHVDDIIGYIAGREFVREAFAPEAKADGEGIIRAIVQAFYEKLPHIPWMDAESATAAQRKARAIIPKVGYPLTPDTTKPDSLATWYARLVINDDFFGNVYRSMVLDTYRVWQTLGTQRNRETWDMYPQTVNAYYSPPDGEIVFPAGILQPPWYSQSWPSHLKYGAFGSIAAHELTHAFDNSGSQYDEKGLLRDWWTNSTVKAFDERAKCVAKQYSKYYVHDANGKKVYVNGNLTNGENIADSGIGQAYAAWKSSLKSTAEVERRLPGLDYSEEQLFFIAFARTWASLSRPATAVSRVRSDSHSPTYWRATGTLRNLAVFHEAFGCKVGSGMNPPKADQCELW